MQEKRQRVLYLDALRLIGTFAVIAIHLSSPGNRTVWLIDGELCGGGGNVLKFSELAAYSFFNKLSHWAVPVFVMISGAIFLNPSKKVTIGDVFRKLFPRLAIPYFFWWLFYAVLLSLWAFISHKGWSVGYLSPYSHLWYLPMLFSIYLIIPLLKKIVENKDNMKYFLVLWFVFTLLESVHYLDKVFELMYMRFVMGYSGYFVLGYYLSSNGFNLGKRRIVYIAGVAAAVLIVVVDIISKMYHWSLFNSYTPFYILMASALFLWFKNIEWSRYAKLLEVVQPYLFGVYLVHVVWVLMFTQDKIYHVIHPIIYLPLSIVIVFFLSLGCSWVFTKIPILKKVVE